MAAPNLPKTLGILREILKYVGSYLLGILAAIFLTPAETTLAGVSLWPFYPAAAIGYLLFYFYLEPGNTFGPTSTHWLVGLIGLIPIVFEIVVYFLKMTPLKAWRALWIAFPIGFLGTLGIYFSAAASI